MFARFRSFCESHFSLLLSAGLIGGLVFPFLGHAPDFVPPAILAAMMGFSYSKITIAELKNIRLRETLLFYAFRFLIVPFLLYGLCLLVLPDFGYSVLLLALLPAAISCSALAGIMNGNATLALASTLISSLFAPFIIPLIFKFVGMQVEINTLGMFMTLGAILFLPAIVYFGSVRFFPVPDAWVKRNASFASVALFSVFIAVAIARLRDVILADPLHILFSGVVLSVFFFVLYALGWLAFRKNPRADRIAYTLFSGCVNVGLGVSLTILYFPAKEQLYMVICEFLWVFSLSALQYFLRVRRNLPEPV